MRRPLVCAVFAKPPKQGVSKTRLARDIGPQAAAALAGAFLRDTVEMLEGLGRFEVILSTPEPEADHGVSLPCWHQGDGDLGQRLERTFARALREGKEMIALGADSPALSPEHLFGLVERWEGCDAVIGPTDDGGFWGLGLRQLDERIFEQIPWSTERVAAVVQAKLSAQKRSVAIGPGCWDIDLVSDLARFRREIPRTSARETWRLLDELLPEEKP